MVHTALVAGGAGFLGSHLSESLLEDGYEVICVDNLGSGSGENIEHLADDQKFTLIRGDIRESPDLLPPADEVYHLASRASPADFQEFPVQIALTNTEGTRNLLDYSVKHDVKMVFASTSEVYGDPKTHPQPESYTGNVNIRGPRGCYDESKRFGETLTVAYEKEYDLDIRTVRIFNTYGPRMRADDGRVVPNFITQALNDQDLTVYGDGSQTRSFCYATDLIGGMREIMEATPMKGDVVNLGRDNEYTIQELAEMILDICDTDSDIVYEPLPEDDPQQRQPNLSKLQDKIEWDPSVPLQEGLELTIQEFKEKTTQLGPQ